MKNKLTLAMIELLSLASVSSVHACTNSIAIKEAHALLVHSAYKNQFGIPDSIKAWDRIQNYPLSALVWLKISMEKINNALYAIAPLPAGNIQSKDKDRYKRYLDFLPHLQRLFTLIKRTCGITDEQIEQEIDLYGHIWLSMGML
jgi:hypothetical protein